MRTSFFGLDLLVRRPQQLAKRLKRGDYFLQEVMEKGKVLCAYAKSPKAPVAARIPTIFI